MREHPGRELAREIERREWTQKDAAEVLGCSAQYINDLVRGRRSISVTMALKLEQALGEDARVWLSRQSGYDLDQARARVEASS
jgi:antitoxin HigA-1